MRTITLEIEDDVFNELRTQCGLRAMMGESHGLVDAFMAVLIKAVEDNLERKHIRRRKKGER